MANNLTPEQLDWLRKQQYQNLSSGSGWSPETAYGPMGGQVDQTAENGDTFHQTYSANGSVQDGGISYTPTGMFRDVVAGKNKPGDMQEVYDQSGRYQTTAAIPKESFMDAYLPFLLMAGGIGATMFGPGAAAMGGAGEAGGGIGAGAFDGAGFEGLTAADLGGGLGTFPSAELMANPSALDYGPALTAGGGAAGAGGGLLGKVLGAGSTVLGALSGGKGGGGGGGGGDVEKKMDPRMDKYIYGPGGLFERSNGLLNDQMTPERSQGWRDMQTVGRGLLNQPVAGNGFERFVKGRR